MNYIKVKASQLYSVIIMMAVLVRRLRPVTKFQSKTHDALLAYTKGITLALTGNLTFPTPPVSLADQGTANDAYEAAILAWGPVGNHGSHAQHVAVLDTRKAVEANMTALADYVDSIAQGDNGMIVSSGFVASRVPAPLGRLDAPANLRLSTKKAASGETNLIWDGVNGAGSYNVYTAATPTDPFVLIATVTSAKYKNIGAAGRLAYYTIRCVGSSGLGIETTPLAAYSSF